MDPFLNDALEFVLNEYGSKGYAFWRSCIGEDDIVLSHPSNQDLTIEVSAMWDRGKPPGEIRVLVSTFELRPKRFQTRVPTRSFLVFEDDTIKTVEEEADG